MDSKLTFPSPRLDELTAADPWVSKYDKRGDTLILHRGAPRAALSVDLDGELWARIDASTGEVLGFEVEHFRSDFLAGHPEVGRGLSLGVSRQDRADQFEAWLKVFLRFVSDSFGSTSPRTVSSLGA